MYEDQIGLTVIANQANQENAKLLLLFFAKFSAGSLIVDLRTTASKPEASSSGCIMSVKSAPVSYIRVSSCIRSSTK